MTYTWEELAGASLARQFPDDPGVLAALLLGVLVGGLVLTASVILPLRQRLRRTEVRGGPGA